MTVLIFNLSSWITGTQNLPGRAHHSSKAGDLLRPQDLLETSICLSRGTGERVYNLARSKKKKNGKDVKLVVEQFLFTFGFQVVVTKLFANSCSFTYIADTEQP